MAKLEIQLAKWFTNAYLSANVHLYKQKHVTLDQIVAIASDPSAIDLGTIDVPRKVASMEQLDVFLHDTDESLTVQ